VDPARPPRRRYHCRIGDKAAVRHAVLAHGHKAGGRADDRNVFQRHAAHFDDLASVLLRRYAADAGDFMLIVAMSSNLSMGGGPAWRLTPPG